MQYNVQNMVLDYANVWTSEYYNFFVKKAVKLYFVHGNDHTLEKFFEKVSVL